MHITVFYILFTSDFIPTHYLNPSVLQQSTNGQNKQNAKQHCISPSHLTVSHHVSHTTTFKKIIHLHHDGRITAQAASLIHPQTHLLPCLAPETRPHRATTSRHHCPAATPLPVQFLLGQWLAVSCEQGECLYHPFLG